MSASRLRRRGRATAPSRGGGRTSFVGTKSGSAVAWRAGEVVPRGDVGCASSALLPMIMTLHPGLSHVDALCPGYALLSPCVARHVERANCVGRHESQGVDG